GRAGRSPDARGGNRRDRVPARPPPLALRGSNAVPSPEVLLAARRHPALLLAGLLAACGGGSSPTSPTPSAPSGVVVSVVDASGRPVPGVSFRVDGVVRAAQAGSSASFELDRTLIGHSLDIEKAGFLLHQDSVPPASRSLELFAVPPTEARAGVKLILYDGTINVSASLARLTLPGPHDRGPPDSPPTWPTA